MVVQAIIVGSTNSGRVEYTISVQEDTRQWTVSKRYNEFVALDEALQMTRSTLNRIALPEKGTFGFRKALNIGGFNDKRQQGLQQYLAHLLGQVQSLSQVRPLARFLEDPTLPPATQATCAQPAVVQATPVYAQPAQAQPLPAPAVVVAPVQAVAAGPAVATAVPACAQAPAFGMAQAVPVAPAAPVIAQAVPVAPAAPVIAQAVPGYAVPAQPAQLAPSSGGFGAGSLAAAGGLGALAGAAGAAIAGALASAGQHQHHSTVPVRSGYQSLGAASGGYSMGSRWNGNAICDGKRADERAEWLMQNQGLSLDMARQKVMSEFPSQFSAAISGCSMGGKWNGNIICDGIRADERAAWLKENQGMSVDMARQQIMNEFPSQFSGVNTIGGVGETYMAGWNPNAMCDGSQAEMRAEWLMSNQGMSPDAARQEVMRQFPASFGGTMRGVGILPMALGVPGEQWCFKCEGKGYCHDSSMPHDKGPFEKCFFCKPCNGCSGSGHIPGGGMVCPPIGGMGGGMPIGGGMAGMIGGMLGGLGGAGGEQRCFKCEGRGFCHDSSMPHDKAPHEKCFFCKSCDGCGGSGHISGGGCMPGGVMTGGVNQRCFKCEGRGFCHDSSMPHDKDPHEKCFFCKSCNGCGGKGFLS